MVVVAVAAAVVVVEGSSPCCSSCLDSLKFFHHDLRSRLLGGEAWEVVGVGDFMWEAVVVVVAVAWWKLGGDVIVDAAAREDDATTGTGSVDQHRAQAMPSQL